MPTLIDHLLIIGFAILLPIHDLLFWYPRLLRANPDHRGRVRTQAYAESMTIEWVLFAAVLFVWSHQDRPWDGLGFSFSGGWGFWLGAAIAVAIIVIGTRQRLSLVQDPDDDINQIVLDQLEGLRPLLPHTRTEMNRFSMVAVTAGICEEVLFRGFLLWYLGSLVPLVPSLLLGAILFGMAHAYQGTKGVIQTGLVGLGLVLLYKITGSLWVPMAVHIFVDLNSGLLAYSFLRRERQSVPPSVEEGP